LDFKNARVVLGLILLVLQTTYELYIQAANSVKECKKGSQGLVVTREGKFEETESPGESKVSTHTRSGHEGLKVTAT
jgi:hypothetical protein